MPHEFNPEFGRFEQVATDSLAMLFDQSLCIGCRACQVACKRWYDREPLNSAEVRTDAGFLPPGVQLAAQGKFARRLAVGEFVGTAFTESYTNPFQLEANTWLFMRFNEFGEGETLKWLFTRVSCMHCVEAPCVYGCPTTALWKHPEGPVELRTDLCIGCRNCIETCPFDVPRMNEELGVVEKCTLNVDRIGNPALLVGEFLDLKAGGTAKPQFVIERGRNPANQFINRFEPACVEACPTDALKWGPRKEIVNLAQQRAAQIGGFTYGIEEAGGTNVIYVLEKRPEELGLPTVYKERVSRRTQNLVAQTSGLGAVAAFGLIFAAAVRWIRERKAKILRGGG